MIDSILSGAACTVGIAAYLLYYFNLKKTGIVPNRLAWIICCVSVTLETITYCCVSGNLLLSLYFIVAAICSIFITAKVWKLSKWERTSKVQRNALLFYSLAIATWPLFQLPFVAHLLLLLSIPVAFFPIYQSAYKFYKDEDRRPWLLWSISDAIVIVSIVNNMKSFQELPYAIVQFVCPFTVYAILMFQRIRHSRPLTLQTA